MSARPARLQPQTGLEIGRRGGGADRRPGGRAKRRRKDVRRSIYPPRLTASPSARRPVAPSIPPPCARLSRALRMLPSSPPKKEDVRPAWAPSPAGPRPSSAESKEEVAAADEQPERPERPRNPGPHRRPDAPRARRRARAGRARARLLVGARDRLAHPRVARLHRP